MNMKMTYYKSRFQTEQPVLLTCNGGGRKKFSVLVKIDSYKKILYILQITDEIRCRSRITLFVSSEINIPKYQNEKLNLTTKKNHA